MDNEKTNYKVPEKPDHVASELVKISNELARSQWGVKGTLLPSILMQIANRVKEDDVRFEDYVVPFSDINDSSRLGAKSRKELKEVTDVFEKHRIYVTLPGKGWGYYPLFAKFHVSIETQEIIASFHPDLKDLFLAIKINFTLVSYVDFTKLASAYSQRMYRFLCSWKNVKEKVFSIDELHHTLETSLSLQKNYGDFKRRVLDVAEREINSKTTLKYSWKAEKHGGNKVTKIRFIFDPARLNTPGKNLLIKKIVDEFNISLKIVQHCATDKSEDYLEGFAKYMRDLLKSRTDIKDIGSYAATTLKNYKPLKTEATPPPLPFFDTLSAPQQDLWQDKYLDAQKIPENLRDIVRPGLISGNEEFMAFVTNDNNAHKAKVEEAKTTVKTNKYWEKAKAILKDKMATEYDLWIVPLTFWAETDTTFQLKCLDKPFMAFLKSEYEKSITDALNEVGMTKELEFVAF